MLAPSRSRTATVIALAMAFGPTIAPAAARVFNQNAQGSIVFPPQPASAPLIRSQPATDNSLDWGYIAIGSGTAAVVLLGVAGTLASGRHRRPPATRRSTSDA